MSGSAPANNPLYTKNNGVLPEKIIKQNNVEASEMDLCTFYDTDKD